MSRLSTPPSAMPDLGPFTPFPEYGVVICGTCSTAYVADEVLVHLRTRHKHIPVATRKEITAAVQALPGILPRYDRGAGVRFPTPATPALPQLGPPETGAYACEHCGYSVVSLKKIEAYARTAYA